MNPAGNTGTSYCDGGMDDAWLETLNPAERGESVLGNSRGRDISDTRWLHRSPSILEGLVARTYRNNYLFQV